LTHAAPVDPPRLRRVDRLDCRLVAFDWPFARERAGEIDALWAARVARNPTLYDGPVLLACGADIVEAAGEAVLRLDAFETRFSRFLVWRDLGWPDRSVFNCFAMPAVRSTDGLYLLGEMGPGHSAEGLRYFPGGTPEPADVTAEGRVDLLGSLGRELAEETGLSASSAIAAPGWTVIFDGQRVACLKRLDWPESGAALGARVRAFVAAQDDPELCGAHLLAPGLHDDPRLPGFMRAFLAGAADGG
jgi:hypothetical protein